MRRSAQRALWIGGTVLAVGAVAGIAYAATGGSTTAPAGPTKIPPAGDKGTGDKGANKPPGGGGGGVIPIPIPPGGPPGGLGPGNVHVASYQAGHAFNVKLHSANTFDRTHWQRNIQAALDGVAPGAFRVTAFPSPLNYYWFEYNVAVLKNTDTPPVPNWLTKDVTSSITDVTVLV
jgi:hypothetical protein